MLFLCYLCVLSLGCSCYVVSISASDWLERLVSKMTYNVLMGTLNPTHSLTLEVEGHHSLLCWLFDTKPQVWEWMEKEDHRRDNWHLEIWWLKCCIWVCIPAHSIYRVNDRECVVKQSLWSADNISRAKSVPVIIQVYLRVSPGHGKSWNLGRPFSRPGKSWKIAKVIESHGKVMENDDNVMEFLLLHWAIL